jgi:hypothetical protein
LDQVGVSSPLFRRLPFLEKKYTITMVDNIGTDIPVFPLWDRRPLVASATHPTDASSVTIGGQGTYS